MKIKKISTTKPMQGYISDTLNVGDKTTNAPSIRIIEEVFTPPMITYYNDENIKTSVKNGQVFKKGMSFMIDKGSAILKDENKMEFNEYNGETLSDGIYTIIATNEYDLSNVKTVIIDTTPPVVSGTKAGIYTEPQTIIFEDFDDVAVATLTDSAGNVRDLKAEGNSEVLIDVAGTYTLKVEDKYGNAIVPMQIAIII